MNTQTPYKLKNHIRIVSAASLFDGHDASINVMRRILQSSGAEVIHLGHNRSVEEIVNCAIHEDAQSIAITSYQGGHIEYFKYMFDMLKEKGFGHVKIFGGGGGVILPDEIKELQDYGITRIYSPDDGRRMGLQGMINEVMELSDFPTGKDIKIDPEKIKSRDVISISRLISAAENYPSEVKNDLEKLVKSCKNKNTPVIGITGTGGSGKSSIIDEIIRRFLNHFKDKTLAVISVDPSKRRTGGALLGDRIRMNSINDPRIYMRSLATRQSNFSLSKHINEVLCISKSAGFDLIILESSGIGQSSSEIVDYSDLTLYVMTPEFGAATQLEKIDMLDFSDIVAVNKFDKQGAEDALKAVRKQYQRNHNAFDKSPDEMPVFGTIASRYHDTGLDNLYNAIIDLLHEKTGFTKPPKLASIREQNGIAYIIPPKRVRYLSEISETVRNYNENSERYSEIADRLYGLQKSIDSIKAENLENSSELIKELQSIYKKLEKSIPSEYMEIIRSWGRVVKKYSKDVYSYTVRGKEIKVQTFVTSLSQQKIPKISLPKFRSWGDILKWNMKENVPGEYPYAAGVFPFKMEAESPTRMFAGEGGPERTNKRFHYVSKGMPARRLSTAFDSVTLYGANPAIRPDIYGKVGNSGVSVACLDDCKKLYSGFDLVHPKTSVSMTINGPAAILVAYYMNTAIDQQCEVYIKKNGLEKEIQKKIDNIFSERGVKKPAYQGKLPEGNNGLGLMLLGVCGAKGLPKEVYSRIKKETISKIRGTVQADILKEDQAQNTCIFSTDFALRLMGDIQEYFTENKVRNFYSVSISGYHIAEAGANPITQLAFTLSNGFTYVEYYLSRGMKIDDFAPNLSFFFSNGLDPEYTVIGRVARIIWAKAMKYKYNANTRSQKLKYHIQTSGRSLHAQEIEFNDIRTSLQALNAIYDNCNSLHTNAFDEAITTPTEASVRRALAIQLIIDKELGLSKNQNPLQGSFIIEELTDLVEEAVLMEFDRLTDRGGVLGAMETMYQRSKIQEESLLYETLKHSGELPIIGVNTFLTKDSFETIVPETVTRATEKEKAYQVSMLKEFHKKNEDQAPELLNNLKKAVLEDKNTFYAMMEAAKCCSLGQITNALYEVGGQYRRNM